MNYYKVVRERDGQFRSAIVNGKACLSYRVGERTYGLEGTPVLVFRDQDNARRFATRWRSPKKLQVLKGRAGNPREQTWVAFVDLTRRLLAFWKRGGGRWLGKSGYAPAGTYAADWFEPTGVVQ